jgi:hypothetical protein
MKLKYLFLSMLGAALFVGCNNEIGGDGPEPKDELGGISTTATFRFSASKASTYAGSGELDGVGNEGKLGDAALFIYKINGVPEAMAYVTQVDVTTPASQQVTVKCYSGEKLIYLAANIGGNILIPAAGGANNSTSPDYFGDEWTEGVDPYFNELNAPIWANATGVAIEGSAFTAVGYNASSLILALTGNGSTATTAGNGVLTVTDAASPTTGSYYLMSNWGNASQTNLDDVATGSTFQSTCKFRLEAGISADDSRAEPADYTNANKKNALMINVQRAVAKISVAPIAQGVLDAAGTSPTATNYGQLRLIGTDRTGAGAKWAVGNINNSEYPFQMFTDNKVMSTRYADTASLLNNTAYPIGSWELKVDNSRFAGSSAAYKAGNLTNAVVNAAIDAAPNQLFNTATVKNYVYLPENNNGSTLNQYSTFVVLAGTYYPANYISSVNNMGNPVFEDGSFQANVANQKPVYSPTVSTSLDTMYYVRSFDQGLFFHGMLALRQYVCYYLQKNDFTAGIHTSAAQIVPASDITATNYINTLKVATGDVYSDLQEYYKGQCYYKIWVWDIAASQAVNQILVRRNHIYDISISKINGPGIGDPNQIIDPDPTDPEPIIEAETYVTATINVLKWHVVNQSSELDY